MAGALVSVYHTGPSLTKPWLSEEKESFSIDQESLSVEKESFSID